MRPRTETYIRDTDRQVLPPLKGDGNIFDQEPSVYALWLEANDLEGAARLMERLAEQYETQGGKDVEIKHLHACAKAVRKRDREMSAAWS
jgi:hypothetical protein